MSLGCSKNDYSCASAPEWVYSTNYWTASASSGKFIWYVLNNGVFFDWGVFYKGVVGFRPVITIKKSEL